MHYGDSLRSPQPTSKPGSPEGAEHTRLPPQSSRGPDTSGAVFLPPIQRAGEAVESASSAAALASSPCSPMRRARRAELTAYALGQSPGDSTSAGLLLDLGIVQQKLAGATTQQEDLGRLALETWVDDMLKCCRSTQTAKSQQLQATADQSHVACAAKGAAAAGLARLQLLGAGMTQEAVDQLYRGLFVYSVGFADVLKSLLAHNDRRQELLYTIWTSYLGIAELAVKATFKSEYLSLVEAAGTAMAELMGSKHALAEAQRHNAAMVKDLGWLAAAEAEAAAARRGLKVQVEELQAGLSKEQKAHQHAVKQYVDALDARSTVQLQWEDTKQQLDALRKQHATLNADRCQLQKQYDTLVEQCRVVRDVCKHVDQALSLDPQLAESLSGQQHRPVGSSQQQAEGAVSLVCMSGSLQDEQGTCSTGEQLAAGAESPAADDATDLQPLVERLQQQVQIMYCQWRSALEAKASALTENFKLGDELRAAREDIHSTEQQMQLLQKSHDQLEQQLHHSQATCADQESRLLEAHEAIAQHLLDLEQTAGLLQQARSNIDSLALQCAQYEVSNRDLKDGLTDKEKECTKLEQLLQEAGKKLVWKHRLMAEVSKGFSVAMQSLQAQQTARGVSRRLLEAERRKGAHLGSSLEGKDARLHHLDAMVQDQQHQIAKLQSEVALLETTLTDTQKQAMSLGGRLALSETRNEELMNQIQEQQDHLNEVSTRLNKTATKLELSQSQLDKAAREIKALKEAAEVAERQLADGRLTAKSLKAEVDRLTREKQDLQERAQATKARLELEIQRISGELDTLERKLELMTADLVAERDKAAGTRTKLERKRGKKQRWKSAYTTAVSEVESLHQQLLSKQKELEAFDSRLRKMETELRMLAATNTVRLPATAAGRPGAGKENSRPTSANTVLVVDLAAARRAHEAAAADALEHAQQCLKIDDVMEQVELAKQQLLLRLAGPEHTEDSIKSLRSAVDEKAEELRQLNEEREAIEVKRAEAAARTRAAESALREAHQQKLVQRQRLLEQQALQASDLINAATLSQLEAAEASELTCRDQLNKHLEAFEASQADKVALAKRMEELQAGIDNFVKRISDLQDEKAQIEERLKRANNVINFLQVEISTLKTERERLKHNLNEREARINALEAELEKAQQSVSAALKSLEAKHQADKLIQDQKQLADRARSAQVVKSHDAAMAALRSRCSQLQDSLQWMAAEAWALRVGSRHPYKTDVPSGTRGGDQNTISRDGNSQSSNTGISEQAGSGSSPGGGDGLSCCCVALSDTGTGVGECVQGTRWLYAHQQSGPWVAARAALKDQSAAATTPGVTPRPDVTTEGVRRLGSSTTLPCGLPGLSFNPDSLAVLIGELILDKITSDNRADAQAAAALAASGLGPFAIASVGGEEEVSSRACGAAAVKAWWTARSRKDLEGSVYDFFMSRLGGRLAAEAHCSAFAFSIRKAAARSRRARLFGRCLGLVEPAIPAAGVALLVHFMAQLHSLCGPLTGEATEGSGQVLARSAVQVASELFSSTVAPPVLQLTGLPAAIIDAAGGHRDNNIAVDDVLELVLETWTAQQAADARQIETVFHTVDVQNRGIILCDELLALLQQVNPGAAASMASEQVRVLFASALRASGPGAAAVSASGCAAGLLNAGLLGSGAHLSPHPTITHKPPFSEYRLLHDSWHAVKPAVQELMRALPKRLPAVASEVAAMTAVVKKLDDSLEGCAPAPEAWQCYRRILGFYSHYGKFVEIAPSVVAGSSSSGFSAPSSAGSAHEGASLTGSEVTRAAYDLLQMTPGADSASRPSSPAVAAHVDASGVVSQAASPGDSRPSSSGTLPGSLKLPLASALVRPGSSLQRPGSSPRVASGNLSASRPASAYHQP